MSRFSVEVLSNAEASRDSVSQAAKNFPWEYMRHDRNRVIDQNLSTFFGNLQSGCFWGVLDRIDGSFHPTQPDSEDQRKAARQWAKEHFTEDELQRILEICVDTALTVPYKTAWPGTNLGHSILFEHLVTKPDSMFKDTVRENFRKRLNNGRFWESLPDMVYGVNGGIAYRVVNDVLTNYFDDLDVSFTPSGYAIFQRNSGSQRSFDLRWLSDKGIDNYAAYFDQVNKHREELKLTSEQLAPLIAPYITAAISTKEEFRPRFGKNSKRSFVQRLKEPLVAEYLTDFDIVRSAIVETLGSEAVYGNYEHAMSVLSLLPNPQDLFDKMTHAMVVPHSDLPHLVSKCKESGIAFERLMGPYSLKVLQKAQEAA